MKSLRNWLKIKYFFSFIFILAFIFSSCRKIKKYYDLTEDEKSALLFYAYNEGDSFKLLRNSIDTLTFYINDKTIKYTSVTHINTEHNCQGYIINFATYDNIYKGQINAQKEDENYLDISIWISGVGANIYNILSTSDTITVGNIFYDHLYKIKGTIYNSNMNTYVLTSREDGIIKAWNDSIAYTIVK